MSTLTTFQGVSFSQTGGARRAGLLVGAEVIDIERDLAAKVIQVQNEKLAELCGKYPDRFVAFASLALQHPDLAVQQLETAVKKYNLRGAAIGGSVNGEEFADAKFHPVWAKAEELGVVLFVHPQQRRCHGGAGASHRRHLLSFHTERDQHGERHCEMVQ